MALLRGPALIETPLRGLLLLAAALILLLAPLGRAVAETATQPEVSVNRGVLNSLGPLRPGNHHLVLRPPTTAHAASKHNAKSKRVAKRGHRRPERRHVAHARRGHRHEARRHETRRREARGHEGRGRAEARNNRHDRVLALLPPPPKPRPPEPRPSARHAAIVEAEPLRKPPPPPMLPPTPAIVERESPPPTPAGTLVPGGATKLLPTLPSGGGGGVSPVPSAPGARLAAVRPTAPPRAPVAKPAPPPPAARAAEAPESPRPLPAAVSETPPKVTPRTVTPLHVDFSPGSVDLSPVAKQELDSVAESLGHDAKRRVQLIAYATLGQNEDANMARRLSLTRALNVRAYLIDRGVHNTRMDVRALGNRPDGSAPADRVDIVFVGN